MSETAGSILTVKVVVGGMTAGLVTATLAFVAMVQMGLYQPQATLDMLLLVLAAAWPTLTAASFLVGGLMKKQAAAQWKEQASSEETLLERYLAATMVRAGLVEGAGLFGAVVFLLTGEMAALVAPGLSVALLGIIFPTDDRFRSFVRDITSA